MSVCTLHTLIEDMIVSRLCDFETFCRKKNIIEKKKRIKYLMEQRRL